MEFISHPLIKLDSIEKRSYQVNLAEEALKNSSMIVLPTGMGKTVIALLVISERLKNGKILMLAPTKPLVEQHASFLRDSLNLDPDEIQVFTGEISPSKRQSLWQKSKIVVSTPQVIENDLLNHKISFEDVSHITFDECHRAVGNYAYVYIAEKYQEEAKNPLVLGMTASPGSETEKILEICSNLYIDSVEIKTEQDEDVSPYVHEKKVIWRVVEVPKDISHLKNLMDSVLSDRINRLYKLGFLPTKRDISKKELLDLQKRTQMLLNRQKLPRNYKALSLEAEIFKIKHAIELIETQGTSALKKYFERLKNEADSEGGSKASKRFLSEPNVIETMNLLETCQEHPKLAEVVKIVTRQIGEKPYSKIIVFTNFRDTAEMVTDSLNDEKGIRAIKFIGQASKYEDKGLSQKKQVELIEKFKSGEHNVMVATSVAEEGLDIPSTDLVIFYEPVPSAIRNIQRKGRTGRRSFGKIIILIAKGTKDDVYYWVSKNKEDKMYKKMRRLQNTVKKNIEPSYGRLKSQKELFDFDCNITKIFADQRESRCSVVKFLEKSGVNVVLKTLEIGDYVLSKNVCVERKRVDDLLSSLVNKKNLFDQISNIKNEYEKPLLIVEGNGLYSNRDIHPNAIRGLLCSVSLDYGVPVLFSRDEEDTAALINVIAKREQERKTNVFNPHGKRSSLSLKEQQEYLISSISNIGPVIAQNLLKRFQTVERVISASKEELIEVERVGPAIADQIRMVVGSKYD